MHRAAYLVLAIALLLLLGLPSAHAATQQQAQASKEITVIEKTVCLNVSVSDPITNEIMTKQVCIVIGLPHQERQAEHNTINAEFPVYVRVGLR